VSADQIVCFKWDYFEKGSDAAASIAPTIIRHCSRHFCYCVHTLTPLR